MLTEQDRQQIYSQFSSETSSVWEPLPLSKAELRTAVDAIDGWIEDNIISFNSAIPEPAKSALTAKQKTKLLFMVIKRGWEVS